MNLEEFKKLTNLSSKKTTIRVQEDVYNELKEIANTENLTLIRLTHYALTKFISEYQQEKTQA